MNIGIIGLPQTGRKTLFELLAGGSGLEHAQDTQKLVRGVADIQDPRFDRLVDLYAPKKQARARIDILLPPRIEERAVSEGDIFRDLAEVEVFCHVVRAFENESVYHISGSIDPVRDIEYVNTEFILHDLLFIEKRLERIDKALGKAKDEKASREREVLHRLKEPLEDEKPLRTVPMASEDEKVISGYPLLSRRAMIVVLNVSDGDVGHHAMLREIRTRFETSQISCVQLALQLESEIASLETEDERVEFMKAMGVDDTALHVLTEQCIKSLGLVSFFTVARNEVHQWFVRRGACAVEAAAKVHTDIARGFIRAEVIKCHDLLTLGSEDKVKGAGKLGVKGKEYVVEDGDILFIRFNV